MIRRRLLLSMLNQFKYLPYSYEYLYHSLIPQTIDGKQVKNKARVNTIYGNSVVENQLVNYVYPTNTLNGITFTNNEDGSITISGIATSNISDKPVARVLNSYLVANNYYLKILPYISGKLTSRVASASLSDDIWKQTSDSPLDRNIYVSIPNGADFTNPFTFFPQLINLTQRHPFDTPTTLTDNRVQAILNGGYIPYNSGKIKSVDIGEFSTTKADTTAVATLQLKYQGGGVGTSHDTMEITSNEVVFTKRMVEGSLSYLARNGWLASGVFYIPFTYNGIKHYNEKPNLLPSAYNLVGSTYGNELTQNKTITTLQNDNYLILNDSSVTQATDITGTLQYELATPQVIRIPRKHLGIVDLGTLSYSKMTVGGSNVIYASNLMQKENTTNYYCSKYLTANSNYGMSNGTITGNGGAGLSVWFRDDDLYYLTSTEIANKLSGIYLFYETQDEVADIDIQIGVESGGTLTTDSDVLPNAIFDFKAK